MSNPTSYITSGLSEYVKENQEVIIKDIVLNGALKGSIIPDINLQTGVKTAERIHFMDTNVTLQEASGCGFDPAGGTEFAEKEIVTGQFKVNDTYCPEDLLSKFNEAKVKIGNNPDMPYEAEIVDSIVKGINKQMEVLVFQGSTDDGDLIDGLLTQAADDASVVAVTASTGTTAYQRILDVYMAIPEQIVDDAVIMVSPSLFRSYVQDLVSANLYHYDPAFKGELTEMFLPGASVVVRKCYGLTGSDKIIATSLKNLYAAADLENSREEVKVWFSDDDDIWKLKARWNFGVTYLYGDMVVLGDVE